ncbi:MAG: SGNH/GDSL hydrolase family protein [Clostridia bacterium]|nr:SGNH/GDSL hydrolase family protein [Clostridia bacterium]
MNDLFSLTENPLDRIPYMLGLAGIFRTIACVGDSLSSGEFEVKGKNPGDKSLYLDMFEYSWGQFMARDLGSKVYNFSRGGMTARWYLESFAEEMGYWDKEKAAQAYIMALGVNDLFGSDQDGILGSFEDIHIGEPDKNADNFAGNYARIIERYKKISPKAHFFLITMPVENREEESKKQGHNELLYKIAGAYSHTHVIDLNKYAPKYDGDFKKKFYLNGHMNPAGYLFTAKMFEAYIEHIILSEPEEFYQVGLIGSPHYDERLEK